MQDQYQEGQILDGSDGRTYIVRGGVPVLMDAQPGGVQLSGPDPKVALDRSAQQLAIQAAMRAAARAPTQEQRDAVALERERLALEKDRKTAAGAAPAPIRIPPAALSGIQENLKNLRQIDKALAALDERKGRPQSIGPGTGMLTDYFTQWNDPDGTATRAAVGEIGATKIHDLSGAAVSASEAPRFKPFVPSVTDRPEVARDKLKSFRDSLVQSIREQEVAYSPDNGYLPYKSAEGTLSDYLTKSGGGGGGDAPPPRDKFGVAMLNVGGGQEIRFNGDGGGSPTGKRYTPAQESQIVAAIRSGDLGQALSLHQRFSGNPPDDATIQSARAAIDAVRKDPKTKIEIGYGGVDNAAQTEADRKRYGDYLAPAIQEREGGEAGSTARGLLNSVTFGAAPYVAAAGNALVTGKSFDDRLKRARAIDEADYRVNTKSRIGGELVGGAGSALGTELALARVAATLPRSTAAMQRLGNIIKSPRTADALFGATSGYLGSEGDGAADTVTGTAAAVLGGGAGRKLTRAGAKRLGLAPRETPVSRGERLATDAIGPVTPAISQLREAQTLGVPMVPGDLTENARGLLSSLSRQPGPTRTRIRNVVNERQLGQGDRIQGAIVDDLGPTANVLQQSEDLIKRARAAAGPLYDTAYAAPGASSVPLDDLAARPSFRNGISRAHRIAAEEGQDPTALGFNLNQAGEVELTRVPSFRTLDYVKKGMDDVVEGYRDNTTGRLNLDTEGRAVNGTLRTLLARIDAANPTYAAARGAFAGPAQEREALQLGGKALNMSADEAAAAAGRFTGPQREQFGLGYRSALSNALDARVDGADKVGALIGTPKKREVLQTVLGDAGNMGRFGRKLDLERLGNETYRAVSTGSQTAGRLADDAVVGKDARLLQAGVDVADAMRTGGVSGGLISTAMGLGKDVMQFGVGRAAKKARGDAAEVLIDPAVAERILAAIRLNNAVRRFNSNPARLPNRIGGAIGASGPTALLPQF